MNKTVIIVSLILALLVMSGCSVGGGAMTCSCNYPMFNKYTWGAEFPNYAECEHYVGQSCQCNITNLVCPELVPKKVKE